MKNEFDRRNKFNLGSETYLKKQLKIHRVRRKGNIILKCSAIMPPCRVRGTERTKHVTIAHRKKYERKPEQQNHNGSTKRSKLLF